MTELVREYWIVLAIVLVAALAIAWWIFAASRRTQVQIEHEEADGAAPAKRNQALIDAPPAASPPPAPLHDDTASRQAASPPASAQPAAAQPAPQPAPAQAPPSRPAPSQPSSQPAGAGHAPSAESERARLSRPAAPPPAVAESAPSPTADAAASADDDLTRLKGVGPKLAARLRELGIATIAEIAAWDDAEIERIDTQLGRFQGRIRRDAWPEQARLLAAGDMAAYESRFGKG